MIRLLLSLVLLAGMVWPQTSIIILKKKSAPAGIAAVGTPKTAVGDGTSTAAMDTTGATFIAIANFCYLESACSAPTDSKDNTWLPLTDRAYANYRVRIYYACGPTVGAGHTFTAHGTANPKIEVSAWSGVASSDCFDSENGGGATTQYLSTGSVDPASTNELLIIGLGAAGGATSATIDNGATVMHTAIGTYPAASHAYLIYSSDAPISFTWSLSTSAHATAAVAAFKHQ